ncbi:MAG: non-canonical purine NTP diphosphatase [Bacteroidales bacterium]
MRKILFATKNLNKLKEIKSILSRGINLISLLDLGFNGEIPEPFETLEENANAKSRFGFENYGIDCFADDTGLEVEALNGKPGVYSARYAGEGKSDKENVKKLLNDLEGVSNRKARFRTVISLIENGKETLFEGIVKGEIIKEQRGDKGFGYDPVFVPEGYKKTFAEMGLKEKNQISHRANAVKKLCNYLNNDIAG